MEDLNINELLGGMKTLISSNVKNIQKGIKDLDNQLEAIIATGKHNQNEDLKRAEKEHEKAHEKAEQATGEAKADAIVSLQLAKKEHENEIRKGKFLKKNIKHLHDIQNGTVKDFSEIKDILNNLKK